MMAIDGYPWVASDVKDRAIFWQPEGHHAQRPPLPQPKKERASELRRAHQPSFLRLKGWSGVQALFVYGLGTSHAKSFIAVRKINWYQGVAVCQSKLQLKEKGVYFGTPPRLILKYLFYLLPLRFCHALCARTFTY